MIPECYLDGFTREGSLWLYDRQLAEYRPQTPQNTAVMGHYYAVVTENGDKDYGVESLLSNVESLGIAVIRKLEDGESIEIEERSNLSLFLALLFNRVPRFEREIGEIADAAAKALLKRMFPTVEAVVRHLAENPDPDRGYDAEHFFRFIHEERYTLKGNRNNTVRTMLKQAPDLATELTLLDWVVAHADDRSAFIATDSSFGYLVSDEVKRSGEPVYGLASQKIVKVVALSSRTVLLIGRRGAGLGHVTVGRDRVRDINLRSPQRVNATSSALMKRSSAASYGGASLIKASQLVLG